MTRVIQSIRAMFLKFRPCSSVDELETEVERMEKEVEAIGAKDVSYLVFESTSDDVKKLFECSCVEVPADERRAASNV